MPQDVGPAMLEVAYEDVRGLVYGVERCYQETTHYTEGHHQGHPRIEMSRAAVPRSSGEGEVQTRHVFWRLEVMRGRNCCYMLTFSLGAVAARRTWCFGLGNYRLSTQVNICGRC